METHNTGPALTTAPPPPSFTAEILGPLSEKLLIGDTGPHVNGI